MPTVKFAIPKGSIEEVTFNLLEQAWQHVSGRGRTYRVKLGDPAIDVKILRPQEIPTYVQEGFMMWASLVEIGYWKQRQTLKYC